MKRAILNLAFAVAVCLAMTSCYASKVLVGDVTETTPVVEVQAKWNHNVLFGLIPVKATTQAAEYVGDRDDYVIKTHRSFVNMLVESLTFGLYNPSMTTLYVPISSVK